MQRENEREREREREQDQASLMHVFVLSLTQYPCELLCTVVDLLEPVAISALLLYAARDFRAFSKGLPDLCIYRTAPRAQLALVEVKGPRDRLSPEQEAHLIQLCDVVGITAIVCHVAETKAAQLVDDGDGKGDDDNSADVSAASN